MTAKDDPPEAILWGIWDLISWHREDPDGAISYPSTQACKGRIIYHPDGRMAAFLQHPDWKASGGKGDPQMFVAYSGSFALHDDVVHHTVDFAANTAMIGEVLRRRLTIDGDTVTLSTLAPLGREDKASTHVLAWRRAA